MCVQEEESKEYCLVEVSQVDGVRERVLEDSECPWKCLQDLRKVNNNNNNKIKKHHQHTHPPTPSHSPAICDVQQPPTLLPTSQTGWSD